MQKVKKREKTIDVKNIKASAKRQFKRNRIIVEKPIEKTSEDLYDYSSYVKNLRAAIKNGANFIAIDGKHGSGKSSVINLYKQKQKEKRDIRGKNKVLYSFVNFMNIDKTYFSDSNENKTFEKDYNRFFVNEVINDLYKNPLDFEKLFYYNTVSYGPQKTDLTKWGKVLVDKLILILSAFIIIAKAYNWLFVTNECIKDKISYYTIWAIFAMLVLIAINGINIYKPEDVEKSPMLDIDRCRTNFAKALISSIKKKGTLYIIVDDLDRLNSEEQTRFISMMYNEYKPLSGQFNNIELVFIFTVDIEKISNIKNFDANKVFDFILPIASNQNEVLEEYLNNELDNKFSKNTYDKRFIVRNVLTNYRSIREIKHLINKFIVKEEYLKSKSANIYINYGELFVMTMLTDLYGAEATCNCIYEHLNKPDEEIGPNENDEDELTGIIKESIEKHIIDVNYYLYVYNFISNDKLMSPQELLIRELTLSSSNELEDYSNRMEYLLNNVRIKVVYERIYKSICSDKQRLILLSKDLFWDYAKDQTSDRPLVYVSMSEAYLLKDFNRLIPKLLPICKVDPFTKLILSYKSDAEKYIHELKKYIVNSGEYFLNVCVPELFSDIEINEEIVELLNNMNCELPEYVMDSIIKENIKRNYNEFIETSLFKKKEYELYLYSKIINGTITNDEFINNHDLGKVVLKIISEMTQSWYEENKVDSSIFEVIVKTENIKKICTFESWKIVELILKTKKSTYLPKIFDELINNERFDEIVSLLIRNNKDRVTTKIVSLIEPRKFKIKDSGLKGTVTRYLNAIHKKIKK